MYPPIERIRRQADDYLMEQSAQGVPLVGYVYGFAPPELIRACGAVPVRLTRTGGFETQQDGQRITKSNTCTYCKSLLGATEAFPTDRLTLLVSDGLCEALRRTGEIWEVHARKHVHTLSVPRVSNRHAFQHYVEELHTLKTLLCEITGQPFSEKNLLEEIRKGNAVRALLRSVNQFRRDDPPRLRASELWPLVTACFMLPPERAVELLNRLLKDLNHRPPVETDRDKRLILSGSLLAEDDRTLVDLIELNDGFIVADGLSEGQGAFWRDIPTEHPWCGLARHALEGHWHIQRPNKGMFGFLRAEIEATNADGIIYKTLEFCDPWVLQAKRFKTELDLPFLHVDSDYSPANLEQLRTRIEAFLEML